MQKVLTEIHLEGSFMDSGPPIGNGTQDKGLLFVEGER